MWHRRSLAEDDIRAWVISQEYPELKDLTSEDLYHLTTCLHKLFLHDQHNQHLGSFLSAVWDNDLIEASLRADDVNRRCLRIYASFLYNVAPATVKPIQKHNQTQKEALEES